MGLINHTLEWAKGEALEMLIVAFAGILVLLIAIALWRFTSSAVGQALVIPLMLVAFIFLGAGVWGQVTHKEKLKAYSQAYEQDSSAFAESELKRVERFDVLYKYTIISAGLLFLFAIIAFGFSQSPILRATAVACAFIGLSGMIIDMFSKERANKYLTQINIAVDKENMHQ